MPHCSPQTGRSWKFCHEIFEEKSPTIIWWRDRKNPAIREATYQGNWRPEHNSHDRILLCFCCNDHACPQDIPPQSWFFRRTLSSALKGPNIDSLPQPGARVYERCHWTLHCSAIGAVPCSEDLSSHQTQVVARHKERLRYVQLDPKRCSCDEQRGTAHHQRQETAELRTISTSAFASRRNTKQLRAEKSSYAPQVDFTEGV